MSESPWSEEGAPAPKKKAVPTWAWWVGGGCLFLLLIVGVGGFFVVRFVGQAAEEWQDPERQWANIKQILPHDTRPEGVDFVLSWHLGMDMYVLNDRHGYAILLMELPAKDSGQSREQLLDPSASYGVFGKFGRRNQQRLKLQVQGRELDALRFVQDGPERGNQEPGMPGTGAGATIVVDVTPEDAERVVILQMTRTSGGDEPLDEQVVIDFLEPFHVGPNR
jgi:hypothetical protein